MISTSPETISPKTIPTLLPLENGDRLARPEFERRYQAMPHIKAELIEGVVHVASPLRFTPHAEPHSLLMAWLVTYRIFTPGVRSGDNPTVRLDLDNELQPDAVLFWDEQAGGQARISEDDYIEGAPELMVEIAASSASIDLHTKKQVYRRNGVQEYLVWRVLEQKFDWFSLQSGTYETLVPDADGLIKSRCFPGLWLAVDALLAEDMIKVLESLQAGLRSPEHSDINT